LPPIDVSGRALNALKLDFASDAAREKMSLLKLSHTPVEHNLYEVMLAETCLQTPNSMLQRTAAYDTYGPEQLQHDSPRSRRLDDET